MFGRQFKSIELGEGFNKRYLRCLFKSVLRSKLIASKAEIKCLFDYEIEHTTGFKNGLKYQCMVVALYTFVFKKSLPEEKYLIRRTMKRKG